jgi:hypothetical protein
LNLLSSIESETLFAAMTDDEHIPFCILWFIKMTEQFMERGDEESLSVTIHSLYESLEIDKPNILSKIEESGRLSQFAGELIEALADMADQEFSD